MNKENKENTNTQKDNETYIPMINETDEYIDKNSVKDLISPYFWKLLSFVSIISIVLVIFIYLMLYKELQDIQFFFILLILLALALMFAVICVSLIMRTVGFRFAILLNRLNRLKKKGFLLLKIFKINGRPEYRLVQGDDIILYDVKENGITRIKLVINDTYAKYNDFGGDFPVIEANPNNILAKNPYSGSRISTTPDLVEKFITDSSKSAEEIDRLKAWKKYLLVILAGGVIAAFLLFDLYSQRIADANLQIAELARTCAASVTLTPGFNKITDSLDKFKRK